jgi:hypothetical protein
MAFPRYLRPVSLVRSTADFSLTQEVYEPLWDDILTLSRQRKFKIRSIWIADMSHQGASGVLNEQTQGDDRTSVLLQAPSNLVY